MSIVVRSPGDPLSPGAGDTRCVVGALSPRATVSEVASMASLVAETTSLARFRSLMLTGLAAVAAILAVLGVYGVVALSVAERRREIGVRMTLGAMHADILRQVLGSGARLIVAGVILGLATATVAVRSHGELRLRGSGHRPDDLRRRRACRHRCRRARHLDSGAAGGEDRAADRVAGRVRTGRKRQPTAAAQRSMTNE